MIQNLRSRPGLGPSVFCVPTTNDKMGRAQDVTRILAQNVSNKMTNCWREIFSRGKIPKFEILPYVLFIRQC